MNFDGLLTELARLEERLVEVGATGGASVDAVVEEIAIAIFVQVMVASESVGVLLANIFEAHGTGGQHLSVDECFEKFHSQHDFVCRSHQPLLSMRIACIMQRCSRAHILTA
jgi:hypothetical protein